ncbi:MAG: hypothetical protein ABIH99_04260 [Candidatus Micrarchaeota archaeon]
MKLVIVLIVLAIIASAYFLVFNNGNPRVEPVYTIKHLQTFDTVSNQLFERECKGQFQWQSTGYQYGGIGRLYGWFSLGKYDSCRVSLFQIVSGTNFDSLKKEDCSNLKYDGADYTIQVNDGDIVCVSVDGQVNTDTYGDNFFAIKILNHTDSGRGYAESVNFIYNSFE